MYVYILFNYCINYYFLNKFKNFRIHIILKKYERFLIGRLRVPT